MTLMTAAAEAAGEAEEVAAAVAVAAATVAAIDSVVLNLMLFFIRTYAFYKCFVVVDESTDQRSYRPTEIFVLKVAFVTRK